jgi:CubicO group peptidase (beta-lactamase class C family)
MEALRAIDSWGADHASAGVCRAGAITATHGDTRHRVRLASITKILVAYAVLVGVEEGTVDLDAPAGPPGSTVRHLLAHASGLGFYGTEPTSPVGKRRIYSNLGYELLGEHLASVWAMPVATYLHEAVLEPLGMTATALEGSPAKDGFGTAADVLRFAVELQRPTLISPSTLAMATTVQFPGLAGVLPDVGRFAPLDWGLGFELRDGKRPHWTGTRNSPRTFGHFGGTGTFVWVDPAVDVACVAITDREFGPWALHAWPALSDEVLAEALEG